MKLPGFIPEDLRQLVRFVPTRGWDAVEWKPLVGSLRRLSWQFVSGSGVRKLGRTVDALVPEIDVVANLGEADAFGELSTARRRKRAGDQLLRLYFAQFLSEEGFFLDLRSARLGMAGNRLQLMPNGLWIRLRPEFREGMLGLYRSFYGGDEAGLDAYLTQMGLLREDLPADAAGELKGLLQDHFGSKQSAQRFSIDTFKESFDALFEFFIAHDYRMHSDFVFVGFYLITLYLSLERGGQTHDVRRLCSETLLSG